MSTIGARIKAKRLGNKLSADELAERVGVSRATIYRYENDTVDKVPYDLIARFAKALNTSADYLLNGAESNSPAPRKPKKKIVRIPVLGRVQAGIPVTAMEEILDYEDIPEELAATGEFFALKVRGHSMEPKLLQGDVLIIRMQQDVDDGDIAVVLVNGDDATVKKIKKSADGVLLIPFNPEFDPMFYSNQEIEDLPVRVLGKVLQLRRDL